VQAAAAAVASGGNLGDAEAKAIEKARQSNLKMSTKAGAWRLLVKEARAKDATDRTEKDVEMIGVADAAKAKRKERARLVKERKAAAAVTESDD
jgi:hypothetical protein